MRYLRAERSLAKTKRSFFENTASRLWLSTSTKASARREVMSGLIVYLQNVALEGNLT